MPRLPFQAPPILVPHQESATWVAISVVRSYPSCDDISQVLSPGPIQLANFSFAGHTVPRQAYSRGIHIILFSGLTTHHAVSIDPRGPHQRNAGLLGLGPSQSSRIRTTLGPSGNTVLDNIFLLNRTTPNYITILLGRANEPGGSFPGEITVGELLPGYEAVTSQPQLNVSVVAFEARGNQLWQAHLDEDGIIGPDGKAIAVTSTVIPPTNPRKLVAMFDTGFTLPQVPKYVKHVLCNDSFRFQYSP